MQIFKTFCLFTVEEMVVTRADFINRFKNHINIGGKNYVAYADAALVEVFINSHIENNTLIMKCAALKH